MKHKLTLLFENKPYYTYFYIYKIKIALIINTLIHLYTYILIYLYTYILIYLYTYTLIYLYTYIL